MALLSPGKPSASSYTTGSAHKHTPPCSPSHSPTEQPASWMPPSLPGGLFRYHIIWETSLSHRTGAMASWPQSPCPPSVSFLAQTSPKAGPTSLVLGADEAAGKDCGLSEQQPPGPRLWQDCLPPQHGQLGPETGILGPAISVLMTLVSDSLQISQLDLPHGLVGPRKRQQKKGENSVREQPLQRGW